MYNAILHTLMNKAVGMSSDSPTDARSYFYDTTLHLYRPYQSTTEVLNYLATAKNRKGHFSIFINPDGTLNPDGTFTGGAVYEYWFKDGITSSDLIVKSNAPVVSYVPTTRTVTINGVTKDLSTDISFTIAVSGGGDPLGSTDDLAEGSTNLYFTGTRALNTDLTGLDTGTSSLIISGDTILTAAGKLQGQITTNLGTLSTHLSNTSNPHSVTKSQVGLANVDNTSDINKPVSTATQNAINSAVASKVTGNSAVVGASKTKITYDTKGLVTSGADATTSDIAEGSRLYYTDTRVRAAISVSGDLDYDQGTGVISYTGTGGGGGGGSTCYDTLAMWSSTYNATIAAGGTQYFSFNNDSAGTTAASRAFVIPASGYIKNLFILTSGTQPGSGALNVTLMKGSSVGSLADTALVATNGAGIAGGVFSNTATIIAVSAGDIITFKENNASSGAGVTLLSIGVIITN